MKYNFGFREATFWIMWLSLGVMVVLVILLRRDLEETQIQNTALAERLEARVPLAEYKTIVDSLDRCNERLYEVNDTLNSNEYEYQLCQIAEQFQPDTSEAENLKICRECSAACEERLFWCYYYRDEACICFDEDVD